MPTRGTSGTTRTFLIDSHDIFRLGARLSLAAHPRIEVVGDCGDFEDAARRVQQLRPDVTLVGVRAHEQPLLRELWRIRTGAPGTRVVVLSRRAEDHELAMRFGASATLGKDVSGEEVARAVEAASGQAPAVAASGDGSAGGRRSEHDAVANLTKQERRILALIGQGLSNREIAETLFLAEKTVRNHVTRLLAKLGVSRRTQAALIAARQGALHDSTGY
jgi:two-component system response regulator DevR